MTIKITPNDKGNPPGKLADAELHFTDGPLEGLKLIGFSIWERRGGSRPQRHVPGAQLQRQRRAPQLRAAAADRRHDGAEQNPRADSRGVSGVRGAHRHRELKPDRELSGIASATG